MGSVVVCECGKREPFGPVGLKVVDEDAKVFLDFLIDPFRLSICLRMKGSRSVAFDLEEVVKVFHEF